MSISRFFLRDKVILGQLKLHLYGVDVVDWTRVIDIRLSDYFCSASMVWGQMQSREKHKFDSSNKLNANTGLIFRRIYNI
jgi:hypothetical protein